MAHPLARLAVPLLLLAAGVALLWSSGEVLAHDQSFAAWAVATVLLAGGLAAVAGTGAVLVRAARTPPRRRPSTGAAADYDETPRARA